MTSARRRSVLVGVLLGLAATLIALAVVRALGDDDTTDAVLSEPGPAPEPEPGIPTQAEVAGRRLPDTTYEGLEGGEFRFADFEGRPVVANLWASWCGPCVAEMPDFQRVYEEVGERIEFVGVNHTDQQDAARDFAARSGVTYPLVRDPRGTFASELELVGMPTTVFADAEGVVVGAYPGVLTADQLRAEIDRLFPGVIDGAFALAFTTGMLATVNPCGFAMLPAYLGFFLGLESDRDTSTTASLGRALVVSLAVSAGFMAVFVPLGFLLRAGVDWFLPWARYVSIGIGAALVALGVAMLFGFRPPWTTPKLERGGRDRTIGSMALFGVSYAVASLGCTIPTFLSNAVLAVTRDGFVAGALVIATYGLGMALLLMALTVTLAAARGGLLRVLRGVLRYVDRIAAVVLILAGAYLVYYWVFDVTTDSGLRTRTGGGLARRAQTLTDELAGWLGRQDVVSVGLVLGAVVAVAAAVVVAHRGEPR